MRYRLLDAAAPSERTGLIADSFRKRIFGQPEAADAFANVLEKYFSGLYDRSRPIASLLFLGPTGTGKTASVETFVKQMFGDSTKMIKVDCGEFQHSHEIAKLIGSPPGYLGHRETHPLLTNEKIRSLQTKDFAFTVILFDEIEKANDTLWNLLLGIMDKGTLTTGSNEIVDLRSTVIVMTSNVGSKEMAQKVGEGSLGFLSPETDSISTTDLKDISHNAAKKKFLPEFINRLDEIVVFNTLTPEDIENIFYAEVVDLQINMLTMAQLLVKIVISPAARKEILVAGYDKKYNARFMKREVEKRVGRPLARLIASKQVEHESSVVVDYDPDIKEFIYYGEKTTPSEDGTGVLPKGQVEVPELRKPQQPNAAPYDISFARRRSRII